MGVQVNGDSGNDIELFEVPGVRGCVVSNAHDELREFATKAVAAGNTGITIASQPCAGGIVEVLLKSGIVPNPAEPLSLVKGVVTQLGMLQSNALAGNLSLLAEPGARWVTPAGRIVLVQECMGQPADAAAAGLTWVEAISMHPLTQTTGAAAAESPSSSSSGDHSIAQGDLLVVTYQLWSFKGQVRDSGRVRLCSAVVKVNKPDAADGFKLLHLHEGLVAPDFTATARFAELAASS
eukprot:GHRR01026425.1.p1 GENE.GHRR01026425.1~~GHRR01026425.1.p1  ORF type:complete len:237 (+),score=103.55 GHRR01026425.1:756-1466(+)